MSTLGVSALSTVQLNESTTAGPQSPPSPTLEHFARAAFHAGPKDMDLLSLGSESPARTAATLLSPMASPISLPPPAASSTSPQKDSSLTLPDFHEEGSAANVGVGEPSGGKRALCAFAATQPVEQFCDPQCSYTHVSFSFSILVGLLPGCCGDDVGSASSRSCSRFKRRCSIAAVTVESPMLVHHQNSEIADASMDCARLSR